MNTLIKYPNAYDEVAHTGIESTIWSHLNDSLQSSTNSAEGVYSRGKVPQQLYFYDFNLDLSQYQHAKSITFEVKLACSNGVNVKAPVAFINYGRDIGHDNLNYSNTLRKESNELVSTYKKVYSYTVTYDELLAKFISRDDMNSDLFGVILQFQENTNNDGYLYLEWCRIKVEYETPYYVFGADHPLTVRQVDAFSIVDNKTFSTSCGLPFKANIQISNSSSFNFSGGDKLKVELPLGLHVQDVSCTRCKWDSENSTLILDGAGKSGVCFATFIFYGTTSGYKKVVFSIDEIGSWTRWLYIDKNGNIEAGSDDHLVISTSTCRKGAESIVTVNGRTYNSDGTADFELRLPNQGNPYKLIANLDSCSSEVTVNSIDVPNGRISFNVPKNKEVLISFDAYFYPLKVGDAIVEVIAEDRVATYTKEYYVEAPFDYVFRFNTFDTVVTDGRLLTTLDTGAYVLPCCTSPSVITIKKPTLTAKKYEDIDYIGCVKLKQTHYSPKSTFKDTLLNTSYKNKRYMGKKGAIDETISLNVRLPPHDVTTIQGMVEMDKPIPIDANHKCFEGDSLNHRGWCELYSVKAEHVGNNPLWYDCSMDVKYITHNINTRFMINKGSRVSDYFLPNLLKSKYGEGRDLNDAFYCTTTGTVGYNEDNVDVNRRNIVVLDENQKFRIQSREPLSIKGMVDMHWVSTVNPESRDNHVSRIFRLIDKATGNAVFEYEYYEFKHEGEEHTCRVIGRLLYKGAYKVVINRKINLYNDTTETNTGTPLFGSDIKFKLINNKLTVEDAGFSGKELLVEDLTLDQGEYYFESEINNNNEDLDATPIIHYLNYQIMELSITNEYSPYYQNLLVSPFPVPNKDIIYTRESEDGTIFYLKDDGTECSYNLSPYYQYHTGVSLETAEGIQLINLENGYEVVYISNGLIKIGVNRANGKFSLYRYDRKSGQYILTNTLQLTKYDDMNINSFTDDKLEFQVSDVILTVWRGRPFVRIEHPTEDILFLDTFSKVYAERVGDKIHEFPVNYELVDNTNLLPSCVGSKRLIKSDCIGVETTEVTPSYTNLSLKLLNTDNVEVTELGISQPCRFKVWSGNLNPIEEISFVVDGEMIPAKLYLDTAVYPEEVPNFIEYTFDEIGEHTVQAIWTDVEGYDYALSSIEKVTVYDDTYRLTPLFANELYYNQGSWEFLLTNGGKPVSNKVVNISVNGLDYPKKTNSEGIAKLDNHLNTGEYTVTATFCLAMADLNPDDYNPNEIKVINAQASKKTTVKKGWSQTEVVNSAGKPITSNTVKKGTYIMCAMTDGANNVMKGVVITLTVNGISYTRVTDSNGKARLNINLLANTYDLHVSFAGDMNYQPLAKTYELIVVD